MFKLKTTAVLLVLVTAVNLAAPATAAFAQDSGTAASTPKEVARAQRKAARKVARAKKNAQLSTLEKNGYNPAGAKQNNYPENLQNAESKATNAAQAASAAK